MFLVGTSRGTVSAAYLASVMTHPNVKGYVLTASVETIIFDTERIERPVLMAHHADDECRVTTLTGARAAYNTITKSPRKHFITVSGGDTPRSRALTAHGWERETVAAVVEWMNGGRRPNRRRWMLSWQYRVPSPQPQSGLAAVVEAPG